MEAHKIVEKIAKPVDEPNRVKVKFKIHCIVLVASMVILAVIVSLHVFNETCDTALTFVPNFITEFFDRIRKV